jgi:hypothetical protein
MRQVIATLFRHRLDSQHTASDRPLAAPRALSTAELRQVVGGVTAAADPSKGVVICSPKGSW